MKTLILTLILSLNVQAFAAEGLNPAIMTPAQQVQLLDVLNQLEPAVLSELLSEEGLDWYIAQYNRMSDEEIDTLSEELHSRIDLGGNPYEDPNAPRF